ncbi:Asp-tRNA(Asn)/Glu-tRNA(Gln) amidotransferase subunit GatC [Alicyclobacillus mengziensis]|uniref:Aspartyl/glutamyl-tRNA(Asn/Gln) amidotransferase subunit C n=1 Tax=Alicyclobacillus mengziensis TaxID=2931921 RepID=A0A9X7W3T3_9BACL|nr:Asp-tRNA(Asn)/Glu-tRNA(Gln) amidotransferase subunit GatC [Alicyclobacillus mengziensis]QSO49692.1 Asp-tRNA(Asn)/Glu-tRNA(Gln) amidotransferase subunit GatC [Alicyclobacillus mengziensis]
MLNITEEVVKHVAKLARLAVTEEEARKLAPQLSDIISYAEQLQEVDLTDVPPTSHTLELSNVFRTDIPSEGLTNEQALANAPDSDGQQVRVPAVLEG